MSNSIIAMDITTGEVKWSKRLIDYDAWNTRCISQESGFDEECPVIMGPDYDFGQVCSLAHSWENRQCGVPLDRLSKHWCDGCVFVFALCAVYCSCGYGSVQFAHIETPAHTLTLARIQPRT